MWNARWSHGKTLKLIMPDDANDYEDGLDEEDSRYVRRLHVFEDWVWGELELK
jgi:hypothetical protein